MVVDSAFAAQSRPSRNGSRALLPFKPFPVEDLGALSTIGTEPVVKHAHPTPLNPVGSAAGKLFLHAQPVSASFERNCLDGSMHLYIDANIFLDFFHLTSTDIEELRKLIALIEEGKITLYLPEQTCEEISRNREAKISDALEKFKKDTDAFRVNFPAFTKSYGEFEEIRALLKDANKKHSSLYKKALEVVESGELDADKLISDLIKVAEFSTTTPQIFDRAIKRFRKGNPPGKDKNTVGDELNWETLKEVVPEGNDLYLVSKDRDYKSALGKGQVSSFLASEWRTDKNGEIHFYESLTDFFQKKFPDIKLAADVKNNILIEKLAKSGSFATTHAVVGALLKQTAFTTEQAEELVSIAQLNNQVGWIIGDNDVKDLYVKIQNDNGGSISEESKKALDEMLAEAEEDNDPHDEADEEIPF